MISTLASRGSAFSETNIFMIQFLKVKLVDRPMILAYPFTGNSRYTPGSQQVNGI
jgi:hypothetical protein